MNWARIINSGLATLSLLAVSSVSYGATVNFDQGVDQNAIGSSYQGLTFSPNAIFQSNFGLPGTSPNLGLGNGNGRWQFDFRHAERIILSFASPQTSLSITAADVGFRGARIDAFDDAVAGNLVDSDQGFGVAEGDGTFFNLTVSAPSILRLELYQVIDDLDFVDGMIWDNLVIQPGNSGLGVFLPEGGAFLPFACAAFGLLGLSAIRRRSDYSSAA